MQVECRMQPQQGCRRCIMPTTMCPLQGNSSSLLGNFPPLQGNSSSLLDHLRPWPHIQQYLTPGSGSTLRRAPLSCLLAQAPLNHILGTVALCRKTTSPHTYPKQKTGSSGSLRTRSQTGTLRRTAHLQQRRVSSCLISQQLCCRMYCMINYQLVTVFVSVFVARV